MQMMGTPLSFVTVLLLAIQLYASHPDSTGTKNGPVQAEPSLGLKIDLPVMSAGYRQKPLYHFFEERLQTFPTGLPNGEMVFSNSITVNGTTTTKILTITGGADLAEIFPVTDAESSSFPPPGTVLVIDPNDTNHLKISSSANDTHVAGIVSGAGGVFPGLTLEQKGVLDLGVAVALTGRVYVLASAENGGIHPGDLLTTSNTPGHAMRTTEGGHVCGSILGKALSPLEGGKGLVLILVCLQ